MGEDNNVDRTPSSGNLVLLQVLQKNREGA